MNESENQNTWSTISSKKKNKNTKIKISYNGTSYGSNKKPKFHFDDVQKTKSNKKINIDEFPSFQNPSMKVQFKLDDQKKGNTWSSIVNQEKKLETKQEKKLESKQEKIQEKKPNKKQEKMMVHFVFEEKKVEEKVENTWSSIVKQEKIQEKKPEKKPEKKQDKKMKVRFVFEEEQKHVEEQEQEQVEEKIENTWSSIVKQENKPEKKSNVPKIYMLEEDVDILVKLMKWGDFEVFMDDVITIPYGEKSKNAKKLTEEEINQIVKENS